MTLLGGNDDRNMRGGDQSVSRSSDDTSAAVGYVFQRPHQGSSLMPPNSEVHSVHEAAAAEYAAQFSQKQARWACGDEHALDNPDKWKYNPPINTANAIPGTQPGYGPSTMGHIGINASMGGMGGNCGLLPSMGGGPNSAVAAAAAGVAAMQQAAAVAKHNQMISQVAAAAAQQQQATQQVHHQQSHPQHGVPITSQMSSQQFNSNLLNNAINNPAAAALAAGMAHMQLPPNMQSGNIYDHSNVHPNMGMNGIGLPKPAPQGQPGPGDLVYMGAQSHAAATLGIMPQNQFLNNQAALTAVANRNSAAITTSTAKKLWEKSDGKSPSSSGGPLNTLHIGDPHVWKDSPWSTQGDSMLPRPRTFAQGPETTACSNTGILSPRDATSGLGVKMVEYVLRGSPTNKDNSLSGLEPRLGSLKFNNNDKSDDEKENCHSPFDTNDMKKDDQVTNGAVNNMDDDKGFNRTPGSRQPSPAEESLPRPPPLLDPIQHFPPFNHHMLSGSSSVMDHGGNAAIGAHTVLGNQLNAGFPHQMTQLQPQVMNGVGGMQMSQSPLLNHQGQTSNQIESPVNLLQQQPPNYDVQQLFRSQNPGLAAAATNAAAVAAAASATTTVAPPPNGTMQPQQIQIPTPSQQYLPTQQNTPFAGQQGAPYVINPGQEAAPYMSLITAQMPQYYGVAPWGVYPGNLIAQQGTQPRRPITPSQGAENQSYQVIPAFFDQSGSLVMGPRTGTPMRLVSPAPVLVPSGAARAGPPPQVPPQMYPPQPQTAQQNLYSQQNGSSIGGLAMTSSPLTARRDSFERNTSAFSPSALDYSNSSALGTNVISTSMVQAAALAAARKWPGPITNAFGNLGATASGSQLGAAINPPSPPQSCLMSNRAPGAESKYRQQMAVNLAPAAAAGVAVGNNNMFGSNNSIFSKHLTIPGTTPASAAAAAAVTRQAVAANAAVAAVAAANGMPHTGRSRLLEDFRNQRYPNLQLRDLANHIVEFSQDQHGSRFIQQKLERATAAEKQMVFNEILGAAYNLMTDVFGNYVIQKFFEFGTPEQKNTLGMQVKGHVLQLALQMYGCRVIQKALESISPEQQQEIVRELDGNVLKCVKDQNGNHVVQKCIECVDPSALQFIINAFKGQVYALSTHPYGCRVIQRILEHCTIEQTHPILEELHEYTEQLIQDQYGNYVIQHVLEHGKPEDKSLLISGVRGKVLVLSQHKFASNVVEKCVTHATRAERTALIDEVCTFNDNALHVMMKDQYANYVVQKMIDVSEPTQLKKLMNKIRPHMPALRKYTYGKHINAKLEKYFMKTANPIASATVTNAITNSSTLGSSQSSAVATAGTIATTGLGAVTTNSIVMTGSSASQILENGITEVNSQTAPASINNAGVVGVLANSTVNNNNAIATALMANVNVNNTLGPIGTPVVVATSSNGVM